MALTETKTKGPQGQLRNARDTELTERPKDSEHVAESNER